MVKLSEKVQKWWSLGGVIICRDHIITPCYEMEGGGGGRGKEGKREGKREGRKEGKREGRKEGGRERSEKGKEEYSHEWKPQF